MRIREVVAEDKQAVIEMLDATGVFQDYEIEVANEVIEESLNPASGYSSLCCVNGADAAVGYVCFGPTPCTSGTYDLYWIAVHPDYQRNGLGGELLAQAENSVKQKGGRLLLIETSSGEAYEKTRKFYCNHGYKQLAMVPDFYRPGDHKIIYGKNFLSKTDSDSL